MHTDAKLTSLGGAISAVLVSYMIDNAIPYLKTLFGESSQTTNLGNMARELGGSPFCCNTEPKPSKSSCVTFSLYAVSTNLR